MTGWSPVDDDTTVVDDNSFTVAETGEYVIAAGVQLQFTSSGGWSSSVAIAVISADGNDLDEVFRFDIDDGVYSDMMMSDSRVVTLQAGRRIGIGVRHLITGMKATDGYLYISRIDD